MPRAPPVADIVPPRSANERRGDIAAAVDAAALGDLAPPTQLPSHNFVAVSATAVTTRPVFARVDVGALLAHVRCGASLSANVASLVDSTQHIAAAVARQIHRADFMAATLPRPQTSAASSRPSSSAVHAAASSARPQSSSLARPASASISHLLSQPPSFSSFVKEARRHRYEDAAAPQPSPLPVPRPRTAQQVTFQPSELAAANLLAAATASSIMRYRGHAGQQPAPAAASAVLAAVAAKGHPPPPAAVERLNRPREASQRNTIAEAARKPAAASTLHMVPQPPAEKATAAPRAPARRAIANTSPAKQKEHKAASVAECAVQLPSAPAAGAKKKTKMRKRAPAITVFSLDDAAAQLHSAAAFSKTPHP
jgi:hypothetical protein